MSDKHGVHQDEQDQEAEPVHQVPISRPLFLHPAPLLLFLCCCCCKCNSGWLPAPGCCCYMTLDYTAMVVRIDRFLHAPNISLAIKVLLLLARHRFDLSADRYFVHKFFPLIA